MSGNDPATGNEQAADTGRRANQRELPAEHALLGLLALSGGTAHGYDLARQFRRDQPLGEVIRLEPAMLYKHLKKLSRLGWLTITTEDQAPRPPRQVCHLTAPGDAELRRWLAEPVARTREIRLEFLVKLYFAMYLEPALARRLVTEQHTVVQQLATALAEQQAALDLAPEAAPGDSRFFEHLVLDLRLKQTQAAAAWLAKTDAALARAQAPGSGATT